MILLGVCCQYCVKFETKECPVKTASPWSRWHSFCNEYKPNSEKFGEAVSLREAIGVVNKVATSLDEGAAIFKSHEMNGQTN